MFSRSLFFFFFFNFFSSSLRSERLVKIEELDWTVCPYTYTVYVYPRPILFLLAMIPDYFSCSMSPNVSSTLLYLSPPFRGKNKDRATQLNRRETRKWQRINIEKVCEPLKDERKDIERKRKREKKKVLALAAAYRICLLKRFRRNLALFQCAFVTVPIDCVPCTLDILAT